jgi:hypothetical protein
MNRRALAAFVPPEHGAWAMLLVPFLMGTFSASPQPASVLLLGAWLASYLASYYVIKWLRTRNLPHRGRRFRKPAIVYSATLCVLGLAAAFVQPWLIVAAAAFAALESIAVALAIAGNPRSTVAGLASATAASLMAPVAYRFAGGLTASVALDLFAVSWLAFVGSLLHVKSTIRERDNLRFRQGSIAFHIGALVAATAIDPGLAIPFGFLLLRSVAVPRHGWRPARIGAVELVGSVLVLGAALVTLP